MTKCLGAAYASMADTWVRTGCSSRDGTTRIGACKGRGSAPGGSLLSSRGVHDERESSGGDELSRSSCGRAAQQDEGLEKHVRYTSTCPLSKSRRVRHPMASRDRYEPSPRHTPGPSAPGAGSGSSALPPSAPAARPRRPAIAAPLAALRRMFTSRATVSSACRPSSESPGASVTSTLPGPGPWTPGPKRRCGPARGSSASWPSS